MIKVQPINPHIRINKDHDFLILVMEHKDAVPEVVDSCASYKQAAVVAQRLNASVVDGKARYISARRDSVWSQV